jgi:hypothetical protein
VHLDLTAPRGNRGALTPRVRKSVTTHADGRIEFAGPAHRVNTLQFTVRHPRVAPLIADRALDPET